ncbi:MAG TPA: hypothetical protein ENG71_03255 [Thermoplasmatales archaeon]|nr:hypothetical protein [Thermoplasmatales archaeon]
MQKAKIIVDTREIYSGIPDLLAMKADVEIKQLPVGDYILSEHIAVERKRAEDFLDSLIRKRFFEQINRLKEAYDKPILIIEDEGLFSRNVSERAVYGAIACILTDYEIPVIRTRDAEETASLLYAIAVREQFRKKKEISLRGKKPMMSLRERQQFIIEGLPNVSATLAKRLLDYFGSVKNIMNASLVELKRVEGIGEKKAKAIKEVIEAKWKKD